ncbi:MAG: sugar phosphate isomerase/epimerase [Clostridia bacterium]|nr:sugar phosphate isomerase/epimerase [Clostridia bacterium]
MKNKICIDVFKGIEHEELIPKLSTLGFDGLYLSHRHSADTEKIRNLKALAEQNRLACANAHSTIPGSETVWDVGLDCTEYIDALGKGIDNCSAFGIPVIVVHVDPKTEGARFDTGIKNLTPMVDYAYKKGVKIAFENIKSAEYLVDTLACFKEEHVGFCFDCGHEFCFNFGVRFLDLVGDRLLCTHLHDNDGTSDLHQLPFDGSFNFEAMCEKIASLGYKGDLALEVYYGNDYAEKYTKEAFLAACKERALRLQKMVFDAGI